MFSPPTPKTSIPHHLQWPLRWWGALCFALWCGCKFLTSASNLFHRSVECTWCFEWFSGADDTNLEFMDVVAGLPLGLLWHLNRGYSLGKLTWNSWVFFHPHEKDPNWNPENHPEASMTSMTLGFKMCIFPRSRCLVDSYAGFPLFLSTCMWLLRTMILRLTQPPKKVKFFFPLLFSGLEFHLLRSSWRENVWNGSKEAQWFDTKLSNWLVGLLA